MRKVRVVLFVVLVALCGWVSAGESSSMELLVVSGGGFAEKESKRAYIPFGTNYFDPHTGWAPKLWRQFDEQKVRRHFELMRDLGVNCARVFLTAGSFQPSADKVEEDALKKLDAVVAIARETGIRLMLTGPDHWEGSPEYWRGSGMWLALAIVGRERSLRGIC